MRRLPLALAGAALLAACSSDHAAPVDRPAVEPSTSTTSTTSTTAPGPTTTSSTEPVTTTTAAPTTTAVPTTADVGALRPPRAAGTPEALARQIATAESTLRTRGVDEQTIAAAALAQQAAYRQLGRHPEWDDVVQAALPATLRRSAALQTAARREFAAMHTRLGDTLPAWHIVAPADADTLLAAYHDAEAAFGIPWKYLAAINLVETQLGRIRGASTAGALGPMQFLPATWAAYGAGGDIHDVHDSVMAAGRYLAANGGRADIAGALYRYNHSAHYVLGVQLYADLLAEHPGAFAAFHDWGVWYLTTTGDVYLPIGYRQDQPIKVTDYRPT